MVKGRRTRKRTRRGGVGGSGDPPTPIRVPPRARSPAQLTPDLAPRTSPNATPQLTSPTTRVQYRVTPSAAHTPVLSSTGASACASHTMHIDASLAECHTPIVPQNSMEAAFETPVALPLRRGARTRHIFDYASFANMVGKRKRAQ